MFCRISIIFIIILVNAFGSNVERPAPVKALDPFRFKLLGRIGDNPFPTNPMADRARGYLLQGKAQTAILNYGNYIDIEVNPNGAWGEYSYLYEVSFLAGVPGQSYSSNYSWDNIETITNEEGISVYSVWQSRDAYEEWFFNGDTNFVGILFEAAEDDGRWAPDSVAKKISLAKNGIARVEKNFTWKKLSAQMIDML